MLSTARFSLAAAFAIALMTAKKTEVSSFRPTGAIVSSDVVASRRVFVVGGFAVITAPFLPPQAAKAATLERNLLLPSDYETRASQYGIASPAKVRKALQDLEHTTIVDVRSDKEILAAGHVPAPRFLSTHCHDCPDVEHLTEAFIPDKEGKQKRIVIVLLDPSSYGKVRLLVL
jgi:hypothetical protein